VAAADGSPHSVQLLVNGDSSSVYLDDGFTGNITQGTDAPSGNSR
jgi:hypothetical protein